MSFDFATFLSHGLSSLIKVTTLTDGVRVTTHCMYPSGGLVTATVRAGRETAVVTDDGGALSEALAAGIQHAPTDRRLASLLTGQGLLIKQGVITSPPVPLESVHVAIVLVANASKHVAEWLYATARIKVTRDFNKAVQQLLEAKFEKKVDHGQVIHGERASHKFANVIRFENGMRLVVDAAVNDPSSICARVVSHLDVKKRGDTSILQRIIYDDQQPWEPDNINLLSMSEVPLVAFSHSPGVLEKIVANV